MEAEAVLSELLSVRVNANIYELTQRLTLLQVQVLSELVPVSVNTNIYSIKSHLQVTDNVCPVLCYSQFNH